jgi:hypothetical protein
MTTERNPNDATFRNITALKKRVTQLETTVGRLVKALLPDGGIWLKAKRGAKAK